MRDIRFKLWDDIDKIMYYDVLINSEHIIYEYTNDDEGYIEENEATIRLTNNEYKNSFIPLQYTGLKDINGKEIYEGDIVELVNFSENKSYARVGFSFGMFKLIGNGHYLLEGDGISLYTIKNIRVIGNIFENPELLTN